MNFDHDSSHLILGTMNGELMAMNMEHLAFTKFNHKSNVKINCIKFSPFYSNLIACGFDDGVIKVFDVNENSLIHEYVNHDISCSGIAFSPINKLLFCSVGFDGKINFFDIQAKKY